MRGIGVVQGFRNCK